MLADRPKTKILVDGGDPEETRKVKALLGFVDGQTTNPTLIAKNPAIRQQIASGRRLSSREENEAYKKLVRTLSSIVGGAGVSIEVFADLNTSAERMLAQGEEMFTWIPNAYIKYPCTHEGLRAAELSVRKNIRVNMTLCFSQEQAAAVYAATKPFGRVTRKQQHELPQDCSRLPTAAGESQKSLPARRTGASGRASNPHKARRTHWLATVCSHKSHSEHLCTVPRACGHRTGTAVLRGGNERVSRTVGWNIR